MIRRSFLFVFAWLLLVEGHGQAVNPGEDKIFRPGELAWVFLTMSPADKAFFLDPANAESEEYKPATFRMKNSQMDTTLALTVGVRLRGNTSRFAPKKSFKIDFRQYGGKKFFLYKKFNLKANVNDPSLVREALTLQQYRELGVPAARTHHVKLYINDEYMGVYLNVEQVDDVFLEMRFGHSQGYMYKCSWGANLSSSSQVQDVAMFESEINKSTDTRVEMSAFVQQLTQTPDNAFVSMIESTFEVDRYLRQLAVEAIVGHWDGYSYNQNNFYLYYNGQSGKVSFLPYDVDNTWGIDWVGQDWGSYNLQAWYMPGQPRPLTTRILSIPAYFEAYQGYLEQLFATTFNHAYIDPQLVGFQSMLGLNVAQDSYFPRSFGFSYSDFTNSFSTHMNNHVKYGIKEYIDERSRTASVQMPGIVTAVEKKKQATSVFPNPSGSPGFYFSSTGGADVAVYHTSGSRMTVDVQPLGDGQYRAAISEQAAKGIYLIKVDGRVIRWIYR